MQADTPWADVAFSSTERDRHLGTRPVSQLNTWPVVSPVNASRLPSRAEPRASLGVGVVGCRLRGPSTCGAGRPELPGRLRHQPRSRIRSTGKRNAAIAPDRTNLHIGDPRKGVTNPKGGPKLPEFQCRVFGDDPVPRCARPAPPSTPVEKSPRRPHQPPTRIQEVATAASRRRQRVGRLTNVAGSARPARELEWIKRRNAGSTSGPNMVVACV